MRILLVEDEAPLRETLAARLKREGFAVDAAGDGEEGLYNGREVPFDMAIIDLGLPKMTPRFAKLCSACLNLRATQSPQ